MADFEIEMRPVIIDVRRNETVLLRATKQVGDRHYWRVAKGDLVVCRLLAGKASSSERLLSKTDIIDRLVKLRNAAVMGLNSEPAPMIDLGIDDPAPAAVRKKARPLERAWPEHVTIAAPAVGPVAAVNMRVLPAVGSSPLWVELSADIVGYLATAVSEQIEEGAIKLKRHTQTVVQGKGLTFDQQRDVVRARRSDGKQKYFRQKDHADPSERAAVWLSEVDTSPAALCDAQEGSTAASSVPRGLPGDDHMAPEDLSGAQEAFVAELGDE